MSHIQSFPPIIDARAQILILGSIPGVESLARQEYYANKRNHFWQILFTLFRQPLTEVYAEKIRLLQANRIALWDVIAGCYREGSLDSAIKEEQANDFAWLFSQYPSIRHVFFNGGKAHECFRKKIGFIDYPHIIFTKLPSTSPAYTISFEKKLRAWHQLVDYMPL